MKQVVYNAATKTQILEDVDRRVVKSQREQLIQAFRIKKEMLAIMKESYIKGSNDHYEATLRKVRK